MLHIQALKTFADVYRAAEAQGLPAETVSYRGWHAGARVGAGTDSGAVLAYRRSGTEAECVFHPGREPQFNIMTNGWRRPGETRPFTVCRVDHGIYGTFVPGVGRLDVLREDGEVVPAQIVAHTFAVDLHVIPPAEELPESAGVDERITHGWAHLAAAREAARPLRVRVFDTGGAVLHEGPLLAED